MKKTSLPKFMFWFCVLWFCLVVGFEVFVFLHDGAEMGKKMLISTGLSAVMAVVLGEFWRDRARDTERK